MRLPKFLNQSVAGRTTWLVLTIMTIIMVTAGVLQIRYIRKQVATETQRQANRSMDGAIKVIDNRIAKVVFGIPSIHSFKFFFLALNRIFLINNHPTISITTSSICFNSPSVHEL